MIAASQPQISLLSLHSFTLFEKSQKSANFTSLVFNHFRTLFHSCRNKSFVCTLLTKVPQGTSLCGNCVGAADGAEFHGSFVCPAKSRVFRWGSGLCETLPWRAEPPHPG